jgi:hypothetical protein
MSVRDTYSFNSFLVITRTSFHGRVVLCVSFQEIAIPCNKENHEHLQELLLITEGKLAQAYTVIAGQRKEIEKLQETVAKQQELLEEAAVAKPQESFVTVSALKGVLCTFIIPFISSVI